MKTIDLSEEKVELADVISLARQEPILLLIADGTEFVLALADDFEQEVEMLRHSASFQKFLDERSQAQVKIPLEEIEREIEEELQRSSDKVDL